MQRGDHVEHVIGQWRREAPGVDRSAMAVIGRISRLAQLLQAELEPIFAAHGLTGGEFDVLAALRRAGAPYRLTPTELSTALIVTSGGMTKRLNALAERGLISRQRQRHDRRSTPVALTRAGRRVIDAALPEHANNQDRLLGELSREQRDQLATLLEGLAISLGDEAGAPGIGAPTHRRRRARRPSAAS